jgi:hypothetical protein
LLENIEREKLYGSSEQSRVDRAQIVDQLNHQAYTRYGVDFNELCKVPARPSPSASGQRAAPGGQQAQSATRQEKISLSRPVRVFIGYNSEDQSYLDEFHTHLESYVQAGALEYWDNTKIKPGAEFRKEIAAALRNADVAVLLVSADFLASKEIFTQIVTPLLAAADAGKIKILPVILRRCSFAYSDLAHYHPANDPLAPLSNMSKGKREDFWEEVVDQVRDLFSNG